MQIFFMVIGYVLLAVLAIFLLLILMPICLKVKIDYDKLSVKLKILFFTFQIYPFKDKKEKTPKAVPPKSPQKPVKENPAKKMTLDKILGLLATARGAVKIALKGVFVTQINVTYPVTGTDSADTAISYGKMQAYLNGAVATMRNFLHLKFKKISLIPDFNNEYKYTRFFACNIWASPIIMLIAGMYVVKKIFIEKLI